MKNTVVGLLIVLMSELVQNNKIKGNKKAKEASSAFYDSYLFNGIDIVEELFIQRRQFSEQDFDMSLRGCDLRRKNQTLEYCRKEGKLEQNVKDICFFNHVVSSYLLIISNLLITFEKGNENKARALKLLTILHKDTFQNLMALITTRRMTSTGEVMREFNVELIKLGEERSLDFTNNEGMDSKRTYFPISDKTDLLIDINQLQSSISEGDPSNPS